jgi:hypothetical protein
MLTIQIFKVWKEHDGYDPTSISSNRRTLGGERLNDVVDGGVVKVLHFLSKQSSWLGTFEVIVVGIFGIDVFFFSLKHRRHEIIV